MNQPTLFDRPTPVTTFALANYPAVAFSGCRKVVPEKQLAQANSRISEWAEVIVGCADGVDRWVRINRPTATIFRKEDYQVDGVPIVAALAKRSIAMVEYTIKKKGVLVAFPSRPWPTNAKLKQTWQSGSGGTWGTILFAVGNGCPTLVYHPEEPQLNCIPLNGRSLGQGWWRFA
jgi:hypothetical protein